MEKKCGACTQVIYHLYNNYDYNFQHIPTSVLLGEGDTVEYWIYPTGNGSNSIVHSAIIRGALN